MSSISEFKRKLIISLEFVSGLKGLSIFYMVIASLEFSLNGCYLRLGFIATLLLIVIIVIKYYNK